jgi:hypothetical protein
VPSYLLAKEPNPKFNISYGKFIGNARGNLECGSAQPSLLVFFSFLLLSPVVKIPEGVVVGFQNFAWAPK